MSPVPAEPVGLALDASGDWLQVATYGTSELVTIRTADRAIVHRQSLPGRPAHVAQGGGWIVACCPGVDRVAVFKSGASGPKHVRSILAGRYPARALIDAERCLVYVSCRLADAVETYRLDDGTPGPRYLLGFPPGCLARTPAGDTLLAAHAFAGRLAVIDLAAGSATRVVKFPGMNIRGLALLAGGTDYLFSHQIISENSIITRAAVFWGALMTNNLTRGKVADLRDATRDPVARSTLEYVGDARHGAGDPGDIAVSTDGAMALCLSGVDELAIDRDFPFQPRRLSVGKHPVAVAISASGLAYVACRHSDDIAVVDVARQRAVGSIPLSPGAKRSAAQRGQILFHDAGLSLDGWYSCASCHPDGHTTGVNADTLGDAGYGAPKNTPTLLGVGQTGPWAWNGQFPTLDEQIRNSVEDSMQGVPLDNEKVADLEAFLRSLAPLPLNAASDPKVALGEAVFRRERCDRCHVPPTYTAGETFDVGLDDGLAGNKVFNPPSLRGVSRSAPYLHDGRTSQLSEVFTTDRHQLPNPLTDADLDHLLAFLKSL